MVAAFSLVIFYVAIHFTLPRQRASTPRLISRRVACRVILGLRECRGPG